MRYVLADSQGHQVCRGRGRRRFHMSTTERTMKEAMSAADADVREILRLADEPLGVERGGRLSRRSFIKLAGLAGGGFALAFHVGDRSVALAAPGESSPDNSALNAY